jgi:hypothetical protein
LTVRPRPFALALFFMAATVLVASSLPLRGEALTKEQLAKQSVTALEFAKTHHPELASLLEQLRINAPKDFEAAVIDLNRTGERLERVRKNSPERYELELAAWKLDSRVRLLAARLAMGGDSTLEDELRDALEERFDLRIKLLKDERDRLHKRVERLDEQVADQERRVDEILNREFAALRAPKPDARKAAARKKDPATTKPELAKPEPAKQPPARNPAAGKSAKQQAPKSKPNQPQ